MKQSCGMESPEFSLLSSLRGEFKSEDYVKPHYKEAYRLAIDRLVEDGRDKYQEFLKGERIGGFLSEDELLFITSNTEKLAPQNHIEEISDPGENQSSSGTYWPIHSDVVTPDLELGWPDVMHEKLQTNIDLLYHPPRPNNPTIKETVRKHIQEARQVIAIVMDKFTDVDIFKETVEASLRGVPVYVLLDGFQWKSFLAMAESQDVKLQQLRNMRVRTVKGQDYLCRSGAKFYGAMEQKFLLVDCHTVIYGSYGFSWSYEKINLSMVQVIRGHLVKSYDEEFRTLYARSTVPAELSPPDGIFLHNGPHRQPIMTKSHSAQRLERGDQLRHTLDTVYRKTCERKLGTRNINERFLEEENNKLGPLMENGIGEVNHIPQYQPPEGMNHLKRHSYAGERQEECIPQHFRPIGSNWNIHRDMGNGPNTYSKDNYLQVQQLYRGQNIHPSYNGNDKQIHLQQQNMPSLENTSKSFMRSWRIESYLKNPDVPFTESSEHLDQYEAQDRANSFMQARMRSSLVLRSTIPEHTEPSMQMNNRTTGVGHSVVPKSPLHYSSMQWNPATGAGNRRLSDDFTSQRQSLQSLDEISNNTGHLPGRNSYNATYASLGRPKGGHLMTNPDILTDSWQKRHSVADPKSNTEFAYESPGHMYGAYTRLQGNRNTAGINAQNSGYGPCLKEDQRSVSQFDVKSYTSTRSPGTHNWHEPPFRAVSAAALNVNKKNLMDKSNTTDSQQFLNKTSKKIKSFLHIPEKKEGSMTSIDASSLKSCESSDTLTGEDGVKTSCVTRKLHQSTSLKSSSGRQRNYLEEEQFKSSKPRFTTEEHQNAPQMSLNKSSSQKKSVKPGLDISGWNKDRGAADRRSYGKFEHFSSGHGFGKSHTEEKAKGFLKGDTGVELSFSRGADSHRENKFEKFFHKFGNLINKNK